MNDKKNALVVADKFELSVVDEIAAIAAEELDGLGPIPFDKVKIPSGGSTVFEVPGEDEDNPDAMKEIEGVILDHHPVNAYWENAYTGANESPDCSSYDGKQGAIKETGEIRDCATCPFNQYGTAQKGSGKACKNMHRIYLIRSNSPVPVLLIVPPTGLKNLRDYLGKRVVVKGFRSYQVVTKVTLKKDVNEGGITYSKPVFAFVGLLPKESLPAAEKMALDLKANNRTVEISADDYNTETSHMVPNSKPGEFVQVDSNDSELPFN